MRGKAWAFDPGDMNWNPAPIIYLLGDLDKLLTSLDLSYFVYKMGVITSTLWGHC